METSTPSLQLFYAATPNGWKVSICLEEMAIPYQLVPVDLGTAGSAEFTAVSPNGKIPALRDLAGPAGQPITLFESGAILIYLSEKTSQFGMSSDDPHRRYAVLQWVMWQMAGLGPMAGQHGHFLFYAPSRDDYAITRYRTEVNRLYGVLDAQLRRTGAFIAGADYTIADMASFPWIMTHKKQGIDLTSYPALQDWFSVVRKRPQVQNGLSVGGGVDAMRQARPDEAARRKLYGWSTEAK